MYSNLKSNMWFESPTKEKTLKDASEGDENVVEEWETRTEETTATKLGMKRSYSTTLESRALTRARREA